MVKRENLFREFSRRGRVVETNTASSSHSLSRNRRVRNDLIEAITIDYADEPLLSNACARSRVQQQQQQAAGAAHAK